MSGEYLLEAEVDERLTVSIAGKTMLEPRDRQRPQSGRVRLEAGKPVAFDARYEEDGGLASVPPVLDAARRRPPSHPVVRLYPRRVRTKPTAYEAIDPLGRPRKATVSLGRRGRELRVDGPSMPGLYQVKLPPELRESIATPGTAPLPVVVRGEIAESRIDGAHRRRSGPTAGPHRCDPAAHHRRRAGGALRPRLRPRNHPHRLAIAAILLLLLESALARWVSRSRRAGDDLRVEFGDGAPGVLEKGGGR